jgi:uncharacterized protein with HEPN domain
MPKREIEFFIVDMLVALDLIMRKTESMTVSDELLYDEDAWNIVSRALEIVGEAMKNVLDSDMLKNIIKPEWRDVVDFRNVVAHEYFGINADQIFDIVKKEVPFLAKELVELLKKHPDQAIVRWTFEQAILDLQQMRRFASFEYLENLQKKLGL